MPNRLSSFLPPPSFMRRPVPHNYTKNFIQTEKINSTQSSTKFNNKNTVNSSNTSSNSNAASAPKYSTSNSFPIFFNTNEVIFELFGIKIFFDDILIICILFFLYQEGIQDEYLFISLILLLLS